MPDGGEPRAVQVVESLGTIDRAEWDACAGSENPFVCHDFLNALEESGSVCPETGWLPQHLLLRDDTGRLEGAAICYLKGHSMGEYVFDYGWAHAYERAGGRYYPKLLSAIPFTPVTGPRLLAAAATDRAGVQATLAAGLVELTERHGVSSLHVNFLPPDQAEVLAAAGFLIRKGHQFHWRNDGYRDFDDFLEALSSRKRKAIRKERRQVAEAGLTIEALTGDDLKPHHWDVFYRFYVDTYDRKWGDPYLTRPFFDLLQERMRERVVLMMAYRDGDPVAGALNLKGSEALFGRNWGCVGDFKFLHFELCYYRAIDFAIAHGLARVEAGTQGEHKIQRGYLPVETRSAHLLPNPSFREAVARFLEGETGQEDHIRDLLARHSPYKQG
ncbi:N-acetyltransferase [Marivibrio halodurans]|uniref:N-acetyltransferase n=1 Tax=Marivibrio halodurans TaxID=2039722 RepID=A0A8J7S8G6_9PROT|nr:GNAT family N-acetyltransferase [Marivibrio halodurans]MBP5857317.1 N-acetyltransferase [Marivibrio halodurans]